MSLSEQMANIGSEVSRALEFIDLSLGCAESYPRLREIARLREAVVDYFLGDRVSDSVWRNAIR